MDIVFEPRHSITLNKKCNNILEQGVVVGTRQIERENY